jgi:hypothetical protein
MFEYGSLRAGKGMVLVTLLTSAMVALSAQDQSNTPAPKPASTAMSALTSTAGHDLPELPRRAQMYYQGVWGVDSLRVKTAESGELVRFTWRVLDPTKAQSLNDKKIQPVLIDPRAGVQLVVPTMEKVGQLRQSSTPEAGKSYWMAFSNSGRPVKRGDRVNVVIGQFKAEGLVVE